jgi:hypothetical protein
MECLMQNNQHERFLSANEELRDFLQRVEGLASGTCSISERDLQALSRRLLTLAPEIGDASRSETLDANLRNEVADYKRSCGLCEKPSRPSSRARESSLRHAGSQDANRNKETPPRQPAGLGQRVQPDYLTFKL